MAGTAERKNGNEVSEQNPRAAGRPKGSRTRDYRKLRQISLDQQLDFMRRYWKRMPLEHMMEVLNDENEDPDKRYAAARDAAPYVHPRLAALDLRQVEPPPRYTVDLAKLNRDELIELRRIMAKAQVPLLEDKRKREIIDVTPEDAS